MSTSQHSALASVTSTRLPSMITVRKPRFIANNIAPDRRIVPSPLLSHLFTALSMTFPVGEQFFVHSVRNVRDQVTDPQLQADISAFIGQEAMHSLAHDQMNQAIQTDDPMWQLYAKRIRLGIDALKSRSPRRQLAATVAYEHFTALLAEQLLSRPALFERFDANLQQLWLWHAVEELEHKSVAFDVYQQVFGNLAQRRRSMRTVSMGFVIGNIVMTSSLMWHDRQRSVFNLRALRLNLQDGYTLLQLVLQTLPDYLAFYRADYHPDQHDHRALIAEWRDRLALQPAPTISASQQC